MNAKFQMRKSTIEDKRGSGAPEDLVSTPISKHWSE